MRIMEEFVQISLDKYDTLKYNNDYLKQALKQEQELHSEHIAKLQMNICDLNSKIEDLKKYILDYRCKYMDTKEGTVEDYLERNALYYGMNDMKSLLNLGFTYAEMDEAIKKQYEVYKKEQSKDD